MLPGRRLCIVEDAQDGQSHRAEKDDNDYDANDDDNSALDDIMIYLHCRRCLSRSISSC